MTAPRSVVPISSVLTPGYFLSRLRREIGIAEPRAAASGCKSRVGIKEIRIKFYLVIFWHPLATARGSASNNNFADPRWVGVVLRY